MSSFGEFVERVHSVAVRKILVFSDIIDFESHDFVVAYIFFTYDKLTSVMAKE
jgi:hypothetical protein